MRMCTQKIMHTVLLDPSETCKINYIYCRSFTFRERFISAKIVENVLIKGI